MARDGASRVAGAGMSGSEAAERWTHVGVLAALALVLSYVESFVPMPVPGVKLGLANVAILVAIVQLDGRAAFAVMAVKVLAAGLLFGNPLMIAYSAAGSVLSFAAMLPLSRMSTMRLWMASAVGGQLHGVGQLAVAWLLLGTPTVWYLLPVLLACGFASGALCGVLASWVCDALARGARPGADGRAVDVPPGVGPDGPAGPGGSASWQAVALALLALVAFAVLVLRVGSLPFLGACAAGMGLLCLGLLARGKIRARSIRRTLAPLTVFALFAVAAQLASVRSGRVVAAAGSLVITAGALEESAQVALRLVAVVLANVAFMGFVSGRSLQTAAQAGALALCRHGIDLSGPALAFSVALACVPALSDRLAACFSAQGARVLSRTFWQDEVPAAVAELYGGYGRQHVEGDR